MKFDTTPRMFMTKAERLERQKACDCTEFVYVRQHPDEFCNHERGCPAYDYGADSCYLDGGEAYYP